MAFVVIALIVAFVQLHRMRSRLHRVEGRIEQLEAARWEVRDPEVTAAMPPAARAAAAPAFVAPPEEIASPPVAPELRWMPEAEVIAAPEFAAAVNDTAPVEMAPTLAASYPDEPPTDPATPPPSVPTALSWSFNFEDLFGRRLPIWAGGITLAIAGMLIVKYAVDAGLLTIFTPWVRVTCGLLFGIGLIAGAEVAKRNEDRVDDTRVRQALSGAGIATLYAAILVAANIYHLIGAPTAFVGLAMVTASALALSIRFGAASAVLGLAGGLAAPAMVGGMAPDVPLLAVYLALTIAGLVGVSRMQRWAWLGILALFGGAGWSLTMVLASGAFDAASTLSVGGLILMLAVGVPLLLLDGPRSKLLRSASALLGAAQLALMVALGGFALLNWALFILLAAAAQWLSWRDKGFAIVPSISLPLSALLLALWPHPALGQFALIGLALAVVHGAPLLWKLWQSPPSVQRAIELCGLALAGLALPLMQFYRPARDDVFALVALAASLVPVVGIATGWARTDRQGDTRFAWLTTTAAVLIGCAALLALPQWLWPVAIAAIAAALLLFGIPARDARIERIAFSAAGLALCGMLYQALLGSEMVHLVTGITGDVDGRALIRWGGLALVFALFAMRAQHRTIARVAQIMAAAIGYGAVAQIVPVGLLPLVAPLALVALALWSRRSASTQMAPAAATSFGILIGWALFPIGIWAKGAMLSLGGIPMILDPAVLRVAMVLKQLLVPALLVGAALALTRQMLTRAAWTLIAAVGATIVIVAVHILYRLGFAQIVGSDFIGFGVAQRLLWAGLLIGLGWLVSRRPSGRPFAIALAAMGTLHAVWYSLLFHNPLWSMQAVGDVPVANLLIPLAAVPVLGVILLRRLLPEWRAATDRPVQIGAMALVSGLSWAVLRQAFHGPLLSVPGVTPTEDILRSLLAIVLAVGFLLWGTRTRRRDWRIASLVLMLAAVAKVFVLDASGLEGLLRIASFVALGFSLIGIGWLYSRQLKGDAVPPGLLPLTE